MYKSGLKFIVEHRRLSENCFHRLKREQPMCLQFSAKEKKLNLKEKVY